MQTTVFQRIFQILATTLLLATSCRSNTSPMQEALDNLDRLLLEEEDITRGKEARLETLRTRLDAASTDQTRYSLMKKLYEENERYDLDSALRYAHLKEELARRMGDRAIINDALNDKADRYIISGMYRYAEDALNAMEMDENDSPRARVTYYRSLISLHHGLKLTNKDPQFNDRLDRKEHHYRDLIFNVADTSMLFYYSYRAENEMDRGRPDAARQELEIFLRKNPTSPKELSIAHYSIAKTYRMEGNPDKALTHNAISAYYDLSEGARSSRSLIKTAQMAMEMGQTDRAFAYITRAYDDATVADARICLEEISRFMPEVISTYDQLNKRRFRDVLLIIILLALVIAIGLVAIFFIRRYQLKILQSITRIKKANELRELTLGQYVAMFTSHINSLEEYRSSIRVAAKTKDLDEITRTLRSDEFIDAKRDALLKEFDRTFLGVFPDFIRQLNSLLKDGEHIGEDLPEGKLTNELRIFALIRLGVQESASIARFLKKSPSTIYNYRVKLRNAAICPNEEFEKRLMEIGKA